MSPAPVGGHSGVRLGVRGVPAARTSGMTKAARIS